MKSIAKFLKEIIDDHGMEYLHKKPYEVYCGLIDKGAAEAYARLVMVTLMAGASVKAVQADANELSEHIQRECFVVKDMADEAADMYKEVFDVKEVAGWEAKKNFGFREFCDKSWELRWSGYGMWETHTVYVNCECSIVAELEVSDRATAKDNLNEILNENPFTSAEEIFKYLYKQLSEILEEDLEDYIMSDDYYPPVMEDYGINCREVLEGCCGERGLRIKSFEYEGITSDFESC